MQQGWGDNIVLTSWARCPHLKSWVCPHTPITALLGGSHGRKVAEADSQPSLRFTERPCLQRIAGK